MSKNPNLKRAHETSEYTPDLVLELKRCQNDPIYFLTNYVKITHPLHGSVPFELYDYQIEMVNAIHENKDTVLLCSRQMGKTTVAAMYILWYALFHKDKRCVIASKAMAHAVEIQSRVKFAYEELPHWIKAGCKFYNRTSIEFENGSKIICEATSEKTGRGSSPSIIFLDEIAFISRRIQEEMWASLTPSLSTGGKFIITSTPNGDSDLFARLWFGAKSKQNSFIPLEFLWWRHPDRNKEWYDDMAGKLGPIKAKQELDCLGFMTMLNTSIGTMTIEDLYARLEQAKPESKVRPDPERVEVIENTLGITVDGKTFSHMRRKWAYEIWQIYLSNGQELRCTGTHRVKLDNGDFIFAKDVKKGTKFSTGVFAQDIFLNPYDGWVYDLVEIEDHEFHTHGVVSHNCEFLSSDALLINSARLAQLKYEKPTFESLGFKFWVPEEELGGRNKIYMVSMDPATGSGKDFTSIEVFDFPGMTQIAEYRSNDVNIPLIYAKLTWLLKKLTENTGNGRAEVLWTFERNGIGEAVSALYYNDEHQIETAELVSDHPAKFGVFTTGRQKVLSALQLKNLVEKATGTGIVIKSSELIHELKHFVSKGNGYEAKTGCTDDSVMATLGIMRLLKRLSEYNEDAFQKVNEYIDPEASMDDNNDAVPFAIL